MKKVTERIEHSEVIQLHFFNWADDIGGGYMFELDKAGKCVHGKAAQENHRKCLDGTFDVIDKGITESKRTWTDPAEWVCCHTPFVCDSFTNTCPDCGTNYNSAGQQLAPSVFWGEETGEFPEDIRRIK